MTEEEAAARTVYPDSSIGGMLSGDVLGRREAFVLGAAWERGAQVVGGRTTLHRKKSAATPVAPPAKRKRFIHKEPATYAGVYSGKDKPEMLVVGRLAVPTSYIGWTGFSLLVALLVFTVVATHPALLGRAGFVPVILVFLGALVYGVVYGLVRAVRSIRKNVEWRSPGA